MENYIDYSNLIKNKSGGIKWQNNIGNTMHFYFNGIEGDFKILEYNTKTTHLLLKWGDKQIKIGTRSLKKMALTEALGIRTIDFKIDIEEYNSNKDNPLILIDKQYRKDKNKNKNCNWKYYKYRCKKCGNEDWILEYSLEDGNGCNCCSGQKIVKGINDIATTAPWMCKYIVNEEDWYRYGRNSDKIVLVKCPYCGKIKNMNLIVLYQLKKVSCNCSDGVSYSEKFLYKILKNKIDFIWQYSKQNCRWIKDDKKYDFYFELDGKEYIIETHGEQHYKYTGRGRSLQEEQLNDQHKYSLAIQNGIKPENYIILDCRKSELEWIKNSILNSKLSELFDLSNIDWISCEEYAVSNIVKEVCDYWHEHVEINGEDLTSKDFSNIFKVHRSTICRYLNKGSKLGWCNYSGKQELIKNGHRNKKSR